MGSDCAVHGAVGRASLSCAHGPRPSSRTAQPDRVGHHPWPERGAATRDASRHADADAKVVEILSDDGAFFTLVELCVALLDLARAPLKQCTAVYRGCGARVPNCLIR